jgi:hypothetical protein
VPAVAATASVPPATAATAAAASDAVAPPQRGSRVLVDPVEWRARHADMLAKLPKEAQPPNAPHGSPFPLSHTLGTVRKRKIT